MNKAFNVFAGVLALAGTVWATWAFGPNVTLWISRRLNVSLVECNDVNSLTCADLFARLGQTGDLFGPVTSLFSGLALLAVAMTILVDRANRRASRKPLLVCQIDDDRLISFDEPTTTSPRAIRVNVSLRVSALNDVGLNGMIEACLVGGSWRKDFADIAVPVPLASNGPPQLVNMAIRLDQSEIEFLTQAYAQNGELQLQLVAKCASLEGLRWETGVAYSLKFRQGDAVRIQALVGEESILLAQWANQAVVQPECQVVPGSWSHKRA